MLDIDKIYEVARASYDKAKISAYPELRHSAVFENSSAISDVIPGYSSDSMAFAAFEKSKFAVLFIDIRDSTERAKVIGAEKTFLTMHTFIPAMLEVIKYYKGNVIDIMGDGIMVFFGHNHEDKLCDLCNEMAIKNAGLCGYDMLKIKDQVVNRILNDEEIPWEIDCGVGVDFGDVIITKIGVNDIHDVKAFGDCINKASKYSHCINKVKVSKQIKEKWPSSEGGKLFFIGNDSEGFVLDKSK